MQRMKRWSVQVLGVALLAALASCGGGGGGGGGGTPVSGNYLPLDADGRWLYVDTAGAATSEVRVVGPRAAPNGQSGTLVETTAPNHGAVLDRSIYVVAADGVRQYAEAAGDPIGAALDGLLVLRLPIEIGAHYVQTDVTIDSGIDFDGDGRSDRVSLRAEIDVIGIEPINTRPARSPTRCTSARPSPKPCGRAAAPIR